MNEVISLLEKIASNAALKGSSAEQLQTLFQAELSDNTVLTALQQNNVYALETALNARTGLICGLLPAEEPQKQPEQEPKPAKNPEKTPKDTPKPKDEKAQLLCVVG